MLQDAKEEVRGKLNIEDVIGEYVQLKRAGRNFKGLSPFSSEKTPSFVVSPDKQIWHDFSSGKGGDVFSFVMEVEGFDFRAALEQLARRAGIDLSQYDTKQSGEIAKKKKRLIEASVLAAKFYHQILLRNSRAKEYVFSKRNLSERIVEDFMIGYAPEENDLLVRALTKRGFTKKELSDAGLTNRYGGDLFRGRITIPLMDASGQVIGFTGRILKDDPKAPKYLNTPQTLIYDKSRHVFGLSQAKEGIRTKDNGVIVEGNLDVVSSHQAGITNVVATAGTAMTEWHLKALARLSPNVALAFDGDKAGLAATERAIPIAQTVGVELSIVSLPESAKDPDELIQQDPKLWQQAISTAQPVVDWVLERYAAREHMETAAGKRNFTTAALNTVRHIADSVEKEHYMRQIAEMIDTSYESLQAKIAQATEAPKRLKAIRATELIAVDQAAYQDDILAAFIVSQQARRMITGIEVGEFSTEPRQQLANFLRHNLAAEIVNTPDELQNIDTYVKIVLLKAETRYERWHENDIELEAAKLLRRMTTERKKANLETLTQKLRDAELAGDEQVADALRTQLAQLIKETARGK
jgi:DNA primase